MKDNTSEWLRAANDDLLLIEKVLGDHRLTHLVAFHSQQCVEKCLKAIIEEKDLEFRKIHNLRRLFGICASYIALSEENKNTVILLDKLYVDARYPGELGLLPDGKPTQEDAQQFQDFARKIYEHCRDVLQ